MGAGRGRTRRAQYPHRTDDTWKMSGYPMQMGAGIWINEKDVFDGWDGTNLESELVSCFGIGAIIEVHLHCEGRTHGEDRFYSGQLGASLDHHVIIGDTPLVDCLQEYWDKSTTIDARRLPDGTGGRGITGVSPYDIPIVRF